MPLQLIDDGYTIDDTVKADGWPSVAVRYRPCLPAAAREFFLAHAKEATGAGKIKTIAKLLQGQLVGWDIEAAPGQPAPITAATIARVPDAVLQRLVDLVTGYGPEKAAEDEKNSASG